MRGKCVHRWLGLGVLTVVTALCSSSVALAGAAPRPPLTGVHAALESQSTTGQFGPRPDVFERAVLRAQADGSVISDGHERMTATGPSAHMPAWAKSLGLTGYTAEQLQALEERWAAYADAYDGPGDTSSAPLGDANQRVDLPAEAPVAPTVSDGNGFDWVDMAFGALLGIALVGLGGIAALAVRNHGRVPQS